MLKNVQIIDTSFIVFNYC